MTARGRDLGAQREGMVEKQLRARGIRSPEVLRVMGEVPREHFLPPDRREQAYQDRALPISRGQTISQPYMVAVMTEALRLTGTERVLEIGTGSGYQTAVLAHLAREVFTVERLPELGKEARWTLEELGVANVSFRVGDGTRGWPEMGPFDAILVTAGAPRVPEPLKEQLSPREGTLVIPVGDRRVQDLVRITRKGTAFTEDALLSCRFVPLVGTEGWETPESWG